MESNHPESFLGYLYEYSFLGTFLISLVLGYLAYKADSKGKVRQRNAYLIGVGSLVVLCTVVHLIHELIISVLNWCEKIGIPPANAAVIAMMLILVVIVQIASPSRSSR